MNRGLRFQEGALLGLATIALVLSLGGEGVAALVTISAMIVLVIVFHRKRPYLLTFVGRNVRRKVLAWTLVTLAISASIASVSATMMIRESLDNYVLDYSVATTGRADIILAPALDGNTSFYNHAEMSELTGAILDIRNVSSVDPVLVGDVPIVAYDEAGSLSDVGYMGIYPDAIEHLGGFVTVEGEWVNAEVEPGEVYVNERFADMMHVGEGKYVHLLFGNATIPLQVMYIVSDAGPGGYSSRSPFVFINMNIAALLNHNMGMSNRLLVTVQQDHGIDTGSIASAGQSIGSLLDGRFSGLELEIQADKSKEIQRNYELLEGPMSSLELFSVFALMASISIIASVFNLVGEERVAERRNLRALGLQKEEIKLLEVDEALIYSVPAACLGILFAGLLTYLFLGPLRETAGGLLEIDPIVSQASILKGLAIGIASTVIAVCLPRPGLSVDRWRSRRVADRTTGGSPPSGVQGGRGTILGIAGGLVLVALGLVTGLALLELVGLSVVAIFAGTLPKLRRSALAWMAIAVLMVLAWTLTGKEALIENGRMNSYSFILMGAFILVPTAVLASLIIEKTFRSLNRKGRPAKIRCPDIMLASKHIVEERARTRTLVFAFALVFLLLSLSSNISSMVTENIGSSYGQAYDRYDAMALTDRMAPITEDVWQGVNMTRGELYPGNVTSMMPVYSLSRTIAYDITDGQMNQLQKSYRIIGLSEGMLTAFEMPLQAYDTSRFGDQDQVWEAVGNDPSLAIIDGNLMKDLTEVMKGTTGVKVGVGERITIMDRNLQYSNVTVVGITSQRFLSGVFVSETLLKNDMNAKGPAILLIDFKEGLDPDQQASLLGEELLKSGLVVVTMNAQRQELESGVYQGTLIFDAFLCICIITVVTGITIQALRAVQERRSELSLLRTIGFTRRMQARGMLFETSVPALAGLVVGLSVGMMLSYMIWDILLRSSGFYFAPALWQAVTIDLAAALLIVLVVYMAVSRSKQLAMARSE